MDKDFLLGVIGKLEGAKTRMKELHWSSSSHSLHIITDDFSDELGKFEDDMVENAIALIGFVYPGEVNGISPEAIEFEALLEEIRGILSGIKTECKDQYWSGLINIVDDFWSTVNRYIYLAKVTKGEATKN